MPERTIEPEQPSFSAVTSRPSKSKPERQPEEPAPVTETIVKPDGKVTVSVPVSVFCKSKEIETSEFTPCFRRLIRMRLLRVLSSEPPGTAVTVASA